MRELELVATDKRRYLDLLLLADEQPELIEAYLDRGDLWMLRRDDEPIGVCVVTDEGGGAFEVQNLAVRPDCQRHGHGAWMLAEVERRYAGRARTWWVGTGDSPITVAFYQRCGFQIDHVAPRGIVDAYDHPIYEAGVQLIDKVHLRRDLPATG